MKNTFLCLFLLATVPLSAQYKTTEKANTTHEAADNLDEQLDTQDSLALTRPYIEIGGSYVSLVAYNGRTEGVNQYGISPAVQVHLGKGWLIGYEGAIWSASSPPYAFSSLGVSKSFNLGNAEAYLGYSRWFFHDGTSSGRAEFSNDIDFGLTKTIGDFSIGGTASFLFGTQRALFLEPTVGWEKSGRLGNSRQLKWAINPTILADFGNDVVTQLARTRPNRPARGTTKTVFGLLTYAFSLPVSLSFHGSELTMTYYYYIPKNVAEPNTTTPFSVFELGFKQRFGF